MNRALLAAYTFRILRARKEYAIHPTACAKWCPRCVYPSGTTEDCETCKATRRMRRIRRAA